MLFNDIKPLDQSIMLLFGSNDGMIVCNSLNETYQVNNDFQIEKMNCINEKLINEYCQGCIEKESAYGSAYCEKIPKEINGIINQSFLINRILLSPFLWWYDKKEIPVREKLVECPKHYSKDINDIKKMTNRLNSGFSFSTLKALLKNIQSDYDIDFVVSLFLDRAVDEGIIVPTIYYDETKHYLYRAFRHGEDLPFGVEDECRLLYFIYEFYRRIIRRNDELISKISMEKIIVLFYQMAIRNGKILNRFLGFNNIKLLKTFLSLHGTIKGFIEPMEMYDKGIVEHFYSEEDDGYRYINWLTYWMFDEGFISQESKGKDNIYYKINDTRINNYLNKNERSCMSDVIKTEISNIAIMISTWYNSVSKKDFKNDSIILTSCSDAYVYASAIATENHYFSKYWRIQVQKAFEKSTDIKSLTKYLFHRGTDNRKKSINTGKALNSGREKVECFYNKKAKNVAKNVANILREDCVNSWSKYWESVIVTSFEIPNELKNYVYQAEGYLYFFSMCYDYLASFLSKNFSLRYKEYKNRFTELCKKTTLLNRNLFTEFEKQLLIKNFSQQKILLNKLISNAVKDSEDNIKNIERQIEKNHCNYTITYKSALIFDVRAINENIVEEIIMKIFTDNDDFDTKIQLNIIHYPSDIVEYGFKRFGFFFGISSNEDITPIICGKKLIEIYNQLCAEFSQRAYEIKAIMLPDIPCGYVFKHNTLKNIDVYIKEFDDFVSNEVSCFLRTDLKHQLIIALTDYVDRNFFKKINTMDIYGVVQDDSTFTKSFPYILSYYNHYIRPDNGNENKLIYSLVQIKGKKHFGNGFLIKAFGKIVCVTCNHIIEGSEKGDIHIISYYSDINKFHASPLKSIKCYKDKLLNVNDEIAILEPEFNGKINFDFDSILSIENLYVDSFDEQMECCCFGYINQSPVSFSESCIFKIGKRAPMGYYTTICPNDGSLINGYSGAIVISNNKDVIIGIHEGHNQNNGYMIPATKILEELRKELSND